MWIFVIGTESKYSANEDCDDVFDVLQPHLGDAICQHLEATNIKTALDTLQIAPEGRLQCAANM